MADMYYLDQPVNITAGDVIRVLEGPISVVEMIEEEEPAQRQLWMRVRDAVQEVLDSTTLEDLVRYEEENHGAICFTFNSL